MQIFFHDVGRAGADRDFPKTVFNKVSIEEVRESLPENVQSEIVDKLYNLFPEGVFNAWGVPSGAESTIKRLNKGDIMLLMRTIAGEGDLPALCIVKFFPKYKLLDLSQALWGSVHFPYIFFFNTEPLHLTWTQLKYDVGYEQNYRPSGTVVRIVEERLKSFGGAKEYLRYLLEGKYIQIQPQLDREIPFDEISSDQEYQEGRRLSKERKLFQRNPKLANDAKAKYGYKCTVCEFNFEEKYGEVGANYIECHHLNPLSERDELEISSKTTLDDVRVVCSNCHRMIHRRRPALSIEELKTMIQQASLRTLNSQN